MLMSGCQAMRKGKFHQFAGSRSSDLLPQPSQWYFLSQVLKQLLPGLPAEFTGGNCACSILPGARPWLMHPSSLLWSFKRSLTSSRKWTWQSFPYASLSVFLTQWGFHHFYKGRYSNRAWRHEVAMRQERLKPAPSDAKTAECSATPWFFYRQ